MSSASLVSRLMRKVGRPRAPNFYFVGHPRSGSGLLATLLDGHPDVFMGKKELHYFGSDLGYHTPARTLDNYLAHFRGAGAAARVGDASTWALVSSRAADEIRAFCAASDVADPRIVLMLRNPVSWLHSLHSHLLFTGDEDLTSFETALEAEADRQHGRRLPAYTIPAVATQYRRHVCYADQVQRYFDAFGRERVLVLINDDFRTDARGQLDRVFAFLGVSVDFPGKDEVIDASQRARNSNRTVRSAAVRRFVNQPRNRRVLEGADPAPVPGFGVTLRALRRGNIVYAPRAPLPDALREQLQREFAPEVRRLEDLLGRDLSAWRPVDTEDGHGA